jgi:hypothetical protein
MNSYFSFMDQFYEQVDSVVMGSPLSLVIVSFYMEYSEEAAFYRNPPTNPTAGLAKWTTHL